jgi:hypothetical protein
MQLYVQSTKRIPIQVAELGSTDEMENHGAFLIPYKSFTLRVIASNDMGWEHVSYQIR